MKLFKITAVALATALSSVSFAETWNITALEWQPYAGSDLSDGGSTTAGIREALAKKGIDVEVTYLPWKRAIEKVKTGELVAAYPAWPEEVSEGLVGSKAVNQSTLAVMHREGEAIKFSSVDDLFKNYRVGYVSTYVYPEAVQKAAEAYPDNAKTAPDETSLMKKLKHNRMDVALSDPGIMAYLMKKEGVTGLIAHDKIIEKKDLILMFKDTPEGRKKMELFNSAL